MIGADTNFLIDFFKGEKKAVKWMSENSEYLCLNENIIYEFLCGNLTEEQKETFLAFVSQFPVFSFDRNASMKSSEIYREAKKKGKVTTHPDSMIAGIYLANNVKKIVTSNKKHFENFEIKTISY